MIVVLAAFLLVPAPRECVALTGEVDCSPAEIERATSGFVRDDSIPFEGYFLTITETGVVVRASGSAGAFYAGQTLRQLATSGRVPCCRISDEPKFPWRGLHLDEARHFFGKAVVLRLLETMARFKLNVLHWHLTDNQGWRIPIPDCPDLVKAVRPVENRWNFRDLKAEGTYGPYAYTRDELIEIVRRAAELHIRIVPELEIPGHSRVLLQVRPDLRCSLADAKVDNAACPGKDGTIRFFERALDEVCEIFPGEIIHIGGDECDRSDWKRCPDCKARMEWEGIADVAGLQSWVTAHFEHYLAAKGRRLMGWDEIAEGGLPARAAVMSWRGTSTGITATESGHDVVMTPNEFCYFDYNQCIENDPVPYMVDWTVPLPWAKTYMFDPLKGIPAEFHRHVLGAQGNNWSEKTCTERDLQWKVWPRAMALSEVLWTYPQNRDIKAFAKRLESCRGHLCMAGVNAAPVRLGTMKEPSGCLVRQDARFVYQCGTTNATMEIKDGKLLLIVNGKMVREFKEDGPFVEMDLIELEPGNFFVTARRKGSDIVVVVRFFGETVEATDRWDGGG